MRAALARMQADMAQHPLPWLTFIALVPRLIAAFFSTGFMAQDDHFLVIESAQSWVDGADYNYWLPWNQTGEAQATGHMMVYPGLHYLLFKMLHGIGITSPEWKMVVVRILHAFWSLIVVRTGYRIALLQSDRSIAWRCGLFLALLCYMPFLSVRNLVEMVSAPLLLLSAWWLLRSERSEGATTRCLLIAGLFAGLAINVRFQTVFFPAGAGLALLFQKKIRGALLFGAAVLLPAIVLQGGIDLFIWGRPFVEMTEYVRYNLANPENVGVQPWYNYLLLLSAVFIPPLSLAVLFGYVRSLRPLLLWLPVTLFIVFHSIFPNKQERFILPVLPLFFVLGYTAWEKWREASPWWKRHTKLWRGSMVFVWSLNIALLLPFTVTSIKSERLEAMRILRQAGGINGMIIEDSAENDPPMAPLFYFGKWNVPNDPYTDASTDLRALVDLNPPPNRANAILFVGEERLNERVAHAEEALGKLQLLGHARPGLLDRVLHALNPNNRNAVITVYRFGP